MRDPNPLPAPLGDAPFTVYEAVDAGVTPGRLRFRELRVPSRGVRIPSTGEPLDRLKLVRPYMVVTPFSAASHTTAFVLWGLPGYLPNRDDERIHISRPDTMAIPRRRGVVGHVGQFFSDEVVNLGGLLITTPARTWLDCSRKMSINELTVVADHLLRIPRPEFDARTEPHATLEELADMLDRHKGTPGIRKARLALEQARVGADSAPETRLRLALENAGLPEPELNVPAELRPGVVRQPDLAYPEHKVAVEYDGDGHSEAAQVIRDIAREEDFSRGGWTLVRISKRHMVNDARPAVAKVRTALVSRGWVPK
ncbi:hypothetical protein ASF98_09455 [Arthrobacter sp. Leaf337]|uniref:hypothetical protein n=1 Tax=Arthrobacter sp. Leaf337 TaxID=1736342 RepID=UPI0006FCFB58|nr:hypothetical protein [Arthrobacter sp. Leaf337]KQR67176.1 hypothetical protein ASF98_09455 [Arthrobacter sp. Leaf337]